MKNAAAPRRIRAADKEAPGLRPKRRDSSTSQRTPKNSMEKFSGRRSLPETMAKHQSISHSPRAAAPAPYNPRAAQRRAAEAANKAAFSANSPWKPAAA